MTRRRDKRGQTLSPDQQLAAWQSASLLLDYPDEDLVARLDTVRAALAVLPAPVAEPLRQIVVHLESEPLESLQELYVETFDSRRRCNLYLTYFAHGDTRRRGVALLRFKQSYLRSGFVLDDSELPDHLCVVLEYAATVDQQLGRRLLEDHRTGLELIRLSLHESASPWAAGLDGVCATLPALNAAEESAVRRLAAVGPPEEEVGIAT